MGTTSLREELIDTRIDPKESAIANTGVISNYATHMCHTLRYKYANISMLSEQKQRYLRKDLVDCRD